MKGYEVILKDSDNESILILADRIELEIGIYKFYVQDVPTVLVPKRIIEMIIEKRVFI